MESYCILKSLPRKDGGYKDPYTYLLKSIPALGYGLETTGEITIHLPMAYGTLAMAAAIRGDEVTARVAADWLCSNPSSATKMGWGLNWAWDSFGKGLINPSDTLYGVTIAMCVDGLFRTYELTGDKRYLETAVKALDDYAVQHTGFADGVYFHYSDYAADKGYRVANITAMLMPQYALIGRAAASQKLMSLAHRAYLGLMADAVSTDQGLLWHYSSNASKLRENDLIHACFIVYGLCRYFEATGGGDLLALAQAVAYLEGFIAEDKIIWEHHTASRPFSKNARARSWAVGMLMFVGELLGRTDWVEHGKAVLPDYEFAPAQFSYLFGDKLHSPRSVAFLMLGTAAI